MKRVILSAIMVLSMVFICEAQVPPASQQASGQEKTREMLEKQKQLEKKIEAPKEAPLIEEKEAQGKGAPAAAGQKVLIKRINIIGSSLLSGKEINNIISKYTNKELTLREMQKVADLVTDAYRKKGFVTSRAYLPLQKIENGNLEIRVLESVAGDVTVKGNRYYKTRLIKNKISMKKGEPFNYNELKKDMTYVNEHPDRVVKAVLTPGKETGATDVVVDVKDYLPIHVGLSYDNFASRFVGRNRYTTTLTHNNLLGFDDIFTAQYQIADSERSQLVSLRYLLPITKRLSLGMFWARSKITLGREFDDLEARGKSKMYSIYLTESLIKEGNVNLDWNVGFDYKDVFNFQLGTETSRDRLRITKSSLDLDVVDNLGRTLVTGELSYGIPGAFGGLQARDPKASRSGAGGEFWKENVNILRLQKMPFDSMLLWKNQLQFTTYILTATEQFQVGGIANVRGYPPAEYVGDRGYSSTWEWSLPPYFIPKNIKVPFSKARIYDAFRIVPFYDWANVRLRRPQPGEEKTKTLRAIGCGFRLNLPENFSVRFEMAWPQDNKPTDGKHLHQWLEVTKNF